MRTMLESLISEKTGAAKKPLKFDLKESSIPDFESFHRASFFYSKMLDLSCKCLTLLIIGYSRLASPRLTSLHLTHLTSLHLTSPHLPSLNIIPEQLVADSLVSRGQTNPPLHFLYNDIIGRGGTTAPLSCVLTMELCKQWNLS